MNYSIPPSLARDLQDELSHEAELPQPPPSYNQQRYNRTIDFRQSTYKDVMEARELEREEARVAKAIESAPRKRKKRWDVTAEEYERSLDSNILTDSMLDKLLPGYVKVEAPVGYESQPIHYHIPEDHKQALANEIGPTDIPGVEGLQKFTAADMKHFGMLVSVREDRLSTSKQRYEVASLRLLLKIKNGNALTRKRSLRMLLDIAPRIGAETLFSQIIPVLQEPTLEAAEQHAIMKVVHRLLFPLGKEAVKPYTYQLLAVVGPMLIDEDYTLRVESREVVSHLASTVGLAAVISSLRPDIDHTDEYVRNVTSRVLATVAHTLGIAQLIPFLKAVIRSKKNWMARHTGIKIVQQLCVLLGSGGSALLPHLAGLVGVIVPGLMDEVLQVRNIAGQTLAQLADNVSPYGMEAFEQALEPVWHGIKKHRGRALASYLRCMGAIVPLMAHDPSYEDYSNYYCRELVSVVTREFGSPDEDMRKTILGILVALPLSKQMVKKYNTALIDPFLRAFWNRRTASDANNITRLVEDATAHLAATFDLLHILEALVPHTKNSNEPLRRMAVHAIHKVVSLPDSLVGASAELESRLVDGILYAFQEQASDSRVYLQVFGSVAGALQSRLSPYIPSIVSSALFRLKHQAPETRQQAADLVAVLAPAIRKCENDDELLMKLVLILYEALGEVYPEVLGSIIAALHACIAQVDKNRLLAMENPSMNQVLPTLTPILKNRQEKVQEACIRLIGLIARKNGESVNAKEWMRICFELLEMLKSPRKRTRIVANETFGAIAKTIGPQDIIVMLLNNLRVQERQLRVCTAVAVGIVAHTCAPFTVLPAIMNEYRVPEKNVQNGVLKSLSFLFEYIPGSQAKDYLYAITTLLEDALLDRDLVHRQTAATVVKHLALNTHGHINTDLIKVFVHLLNLLMPNVFETSPHVIERILESIEAIRIIIGVGPFANYLWAGLFHPARKVRTPYWKMYNSIYVQNRDALVAHYPRVERVPDTEVEYGCDMMEVIL